MVIAAAFWMPIAFAQGGGDGSKGGGGGDVERDSDRTMWFSAFDGRTQSPISICFDRSDKFEVTTEVVRADLVRAFKSWTTYYYTRIGFPSRSAEVLEFLPACNGKEDLKVFLGTTSPEVEKAKLKYAFPYALSERTSLINGRGRGFMWFANPHSLPIKNFREFPDWTQNPDNLYGAILHEVGHLFGCGHIPNTIMREDLWRMIAGYGRPAYDPEDLTRIDHEKELSRDFSRNDLKIAMRRSIRGRSKLALAQLAGAGHSVADEMTLSATHPWQPEGYQIDEVVYLPNLLTIMVDGKPFSIKIESIERSGQTYSQDKIFKRGHLRFGVQKSELMSGVATAASGEKLSLQIEYNMRQWLDESAWAVFLTWQGKRIQIAESVR